MLDFIKKIFGDKHTKETKLLWPIVDEINAEYEKIKNLSDDELRVKTSEFKERIQNHTAETRTKIEELRIKLQSDEEFDRNAAYDDLDELEEQLNEEYEEVMNDLLPEAFAVVKATCERLVGKSWNVAGNKITWEMVPYDVQLMGGIVLHRGKIAEMTTGEGKTLVATLPIYLNALTGRGVHLVTVNDYLALRDSEWMGEIYKFHGLTVGVILNTMTPAQRKVQYNCDITYGTNNEFGFDYLRDNMAIDKEFQVQRKHNYAIVDEVDSVLIDEARTPLIISGPVDVDDQKFNEMKPKIERLYRIQSNLVSKLVSDAEAILNDDNNKNETEAGKLLLRAQRGLPKHSKLAKVLSEPTYKKLVQTTELEFLREKAKNMHIIDDELYFVIDEKNNTLDLTEKGREELAKGTGMEKEYFILPDLGTEISKFENDANLTLEEKIKKKDVLYQKYSESSDRIHTLNQLLKAYTLFEKDVEYVITEEGKIAIVDEFTGRVLPGRRYSDGLHQAIEAKENVKVERDTQTLATITLQNYFRMYNKLAGMTGTAETEESEFFQIYKLPVVVVPTNKPMVRDDQDDAVYRTKREKYNAVIEQIESLREQRRPVLVGTTSVEVSETISRMLKRKNIPHNVLNAKQHQKEAEIVAHAGEAGAITIATNMAGRGTDIKLGSGIVDKGGLYILGTERHESRRIDRQLRGRSGRQGDPGTSKFFLSLEDDLMRLFGSDRISTVMTKMGIKDGEVIEHPMITKSVERAQKKVEENNFSIRKRLLEYDDTMNSQREVIYTRRNRALQGDRLKGEIFDLLDEFVTDLVDKYFDEVNAEKLREDVLHYFLVDLHIPAEQFESLGKDGIKDKIIDATKEFYKKKEEMIGSELMARLERYATLSVIDHKWKEHLREMDDLKEGIGLRAYGQKDPLVEYKGEAFKLFVTLLQQIRDEVVSFCFKFWPQAPDDVQSRRRREPITRVFESKQSTTNIGLTKSQSEGGAQHIGKLQPVHVGEKVGRNDPCPCGSGKKYKQCHGK
ncbi:MAG: preprotein translocase subunit SecA [Ignavibacteria bacterium RIFOXYB2_FULL_35_12]|nr:MAG: preprotein translocase subunit SecA [Ignavibacteria bacterium GWC2_35_8]OGU62981.1 MAG: preprotein translocase subunit SecA [Ignavibacteria bacterium GWF2_35_20]OGU79473.1 MAG: preprotein translocase subunit SecA [Ignavibacteria bacterium RIFOXYA2_FULL_35_9]OGU86568.1 MAG: preprotein translocase subunit SecA [Ignavibacteria bacterium RIFOXYC12_FULL_35_11]OGU89030.1 MAG: preprotein translocase subunit SecA [Ignavibacteria bacterium RIFOXYA12_FULL_35_25]OGU93341.1 MAG: preprotein translo